MDIHSVKCAAGCGGVLRHYEQVGPDAWACWITDPVTFDLGGKAVIRCPECGAINQVESPHVQGVVKVIGVIS